MAKKALDPTLARKEAEILYAAFRAIGGFEPSCWARENHSIISATVWCGTLNNSKPIAIDTLLIMCVELKVPLESVKRMLIARGETGRKIASLIRED